MSRPEIIKENGVFACHLCDRSYDKPRSLQAHAHSIHGVRISVRECPRRTQEEKRTMTLKRVRKFRSKNLPPRKRKQRKKYNFEDADELGKYHDRKKTLLVIRNSNIPNAGRGVFTTVNLFKDDIVTWFEGKLEDNPPENKEYTMKIKDKFFVGSAEPRNGCGMGTFINREERAMTGARKNCEFLVSEHTKHRAYIVVTKNIKAGEELYITYGRGYRID